MTTNKTEGLPKPFLGFDGPNYTQVPDALFDELLAYLSGAEVKVLLYIIRRTFGFKKDSDTISLSQMLTGITTREGKVLDRGTGLSKPSLLRALRGLRENRIIIAERRSSAERGDQPTEYSLNIRNNPPGKKMTLPLVKKVAQGGGKETSPRPWSKNVPTQDTGLQETVEQETVVNTSNIRKAHPKKSGGQGRDQSPEDAQAPSPTPTQGVEAVGDVLARRAGGRARSRPRPEAESEEYQRIQAWIADRAREFYDTAPLKSSTTRAWNLFQRSELPIDVFESKIFQARALTQEATARITKTAVDPQMGARRKSKMAYFFAALEDQAGLKDEGEEEPTAEGSASPIGPAAGSQQGAGKAAQPPRTPPRGKSEGRGRRTPDSTGPYSAFVKS